jgi:hypothetical protein
VPIAEATAARRIMLELSVIFYSSYFSLFDQKQSLFIDTRKEKRQ